MGSFSFIHAADLHIGSPFKGVSAESQELGEYFQKSTFRAFQALVDACLVHEVDFLLVAGDVYDGSDRSLGAQLTFNDGLRRLADAGVQTFVVHGNHDPLDGRVSQLEVPEGVTTFGRAAQNTTVEVQGEIVAAISGISFPTRDVRSNLARTLEPGPAGVFRIGLLHCNVGADTGHEPYAPCELSELKASDMDYWALGHVHTRKVLSEEPMIVYPGNPQGRSIREQGARGCFLVRVDSQSRAELEFLPLDVVRWHEIPVSIEGLSTVDALDRKLGETLEAHSISAGGRGIVCRLKVEGRGPIYRDLHVEGAEEELLSRLRDRFAGSNPLVWAQRIELNCRPEVDLAERAKRGDLLAEVITVARGHADTPEGLAQLKAAALDELWENGRAKKALAELDQDKIREIVAEAELLCLDLLEDQA